MSLGVIPVFAPPRESGFQAAIESFNGRWQAKVWARAWHDSLVSVQQQSARYVTALRRRAAARTDTAPARRPISPGWTLDLQAPPRGVLIYLRRTTERGAVHLLGRTLGYRASATGSERFVRPFRAPLFLSAIRLPDHTDREVLAPQ